MLRPQTAGDGSASGIFPVFCSENHAFLMLFKNRRRDTPSFSVYLNCVFRKICIVLFYHVPVNPSSIFGKYLMLCRCVRFHRSERQSPERNGQDRSLRCSVTDDREIFSSGNLDKPKLYRYTASRQGLYLGKPPILHPAEFFRETISRRRSCMFYTASRQEAVSRKNHQDAFLTPGIWPL